MKLAASPKEFYSRKESTAPALRLDQRDPARLDIGLDLQAARHFLVVVSAESASLEAALDLQAASYFLVIALVTRIGWGFGGNELSRRRTRRRAAQRSSAALEFHIRRNSLLRPCGFIYEMNRRLQSYG